MSQENFKNLIKWSNDLYSHIPWRSERSLYRTLVSEIMLQQTTVGTVLNHFERFLKKYPTVFDLAKSSEEEICIAWKGLGYYRRARSLRAVAILIVENFNGVIPTELSLLLTLKGIGPYTANAILAIGADKKALALDANLERVLARFYGLKIVKGPKLQKYLWENFESKKIMPEMEFVSARALNEALMDLGRTICKAKKVNCSHCPLLSSCEAFKSERPLDYPLNVEKKISQNLYMKLLRIVVWDKKKILVYQKNENEWLSGQWEIPTFLIETNDQSLKQYPLIRESFPIENLKSMKTSITKYKIENYVSTMNLQEFQKTICFKNEIYVFKDNDKELNLSTTSLKALKLLHTAK